MTSCVKPILFIGNTNTKHYYSEPHLKKMRLVLTCTTITLDHIILSPRFACCDVTISLTFLDFVHFCVRLVVMGFKQISAETIGVIVYLCNDGKSHRFNAKETGTSYQSIQKVLKRRRGSAEYECQPQSGRNQMSS